MCVRLCLVSIAVPSHWDPTPVSSVLVLLSKHNPKHTAELGQVHASWQRTAGSGTLVSVYRIQNLSQHSRYESFKQTNL